MAENTGMLCYAVLPQEKPVSVQMRGKGWGQRLQRPVLVEKLIIRLQLNLAWSRKMRHIFSEVYICSYFAGQRKFMFKICMLALREPVFVLG